MGGWDGSAAMYACAKSCGNQNECGCESGDHGDHGGNDGYGRDEFHRFQDTHDADSSDMFLQVTRFYDFPYFAGYTTAGQEWREDGTGGPVNVPFGYCIPYA